MARRTIHNIQPDLDILQGAGRTTQLRPRALLLPAGVAAIELPTIAAANDYWRQ